MSSPIPSPRRAILQELFAEYKFWMAGKPWYYHVVAIAIAMIIGGLIKHYCPTCTATPPAPAVSTVAPPPVDEAQPKLVGAAERQKIGDGHRIVAEHFRRRVERQLARDWFKSVGGPEKIPADTTPHATANRLTDEMIVDALAQAGAFDRTGEPGPILGFLQRIAKWIAEHPEQVAAIIKILLSLLMVFGEPVALQIELLPDGGACVTAFYEWGSMICFA